MLGVAALLLAIPGLATAQDRQGGHAIQADQMTWGPAPPVLPKGAQFTVLSGHPEKAGPFTIRLKAPAGYKVPAHSHPTDEVVTVISGDFGIGMGDKLDESKAERLGAGGFVNLPKNMNHYAIALTDVVVQITSEGPFAIRYVNPADDPSRTQ
jgi:quercetin dioxygenase-like cupin family protein